MISKSTSCVEIQAYSFHSDRLSTSGKLVRKYSGSTTRDKSRPINFLEALTCANTLFNELFMSSRDEFESVQELTALHSVCSASALYLWDNELILTVYNLAFS